MTSSQTPTNEPEEEYTPIDDGDYVTVDRVKFYEVGRNWSAFYRSARPTVTVGRLENWGKVLKAKMEKDCVWPNVWEFDGREYTNITELMDDLANEPEPEDTDDEDSE